MSRARHKAGGGRLNMVASGNPDVIKEAEGKEEYAKGDEKKRGGKVHKKRAAGGKVLGLMTGGGVKHRSDRAGFKRGGHVAGAHDDGHEMKNRHGHSMSHSRPGRKRGGGVGADTSPLSSAHRTASAESSPKTQEGGMSD
jgi:hypothetical protein